MTTLAQRYLQEMSEMQMQLDGERILSASIKNSFAQSQIELEAANKRIKELERLLQIKDEIGRAHV